MRIIAGSARGRGFDAPAGRNTRPTLDRVREAMFGMVQFDIEGGRVLDLFAGSGALGLEALSRGAAHAVFCDRDRTAAELVRKNAEKLGFSDRASVFCSDCFTLLDRLSAEKERFSLVLLDPPYAAGLLDGVIERLTELDLLENGCIILAEHSKKSPPPAERPGMHCREPRCYGDTAVTYIRFSTEEA